MGDFNYFLFCIILNGPNLETGEHGYALWVMHKERFFLTGGLWPFGGERTEGDMSRQKVQATRTQGASLRVDSMAGGSGLAATKTFLWQGRCKRTEWRKNYL